MEAWKYGLCYVVECEIPVSPVLAQIVCVLVPFWKAMLGLIRLCLIFFLYTGSLLKVDMVLRCIVAGCLQKAIVVNVW